MSINDERLKKMVTSDLYTRFSGILILSNISLLLVSTHGDILMEFNTSPDYCKYVCQCHKGVICEDYAERLENGTEGRFVCKKGLENIIIPIYIDEETAGYIVGMQVYLKENEYLRFMNDINALAQEKNLDAEYVAKSISSIQTVEDNKLDVHKQLCSHIAQNITSDLSGNHHEATKDVERLSIEKELLEKKILDLEAKNMSLVINPHFLFNTLNSIARIAYFEDSHKTEELIYCLSDLLRYNLKQNGELNTIGAEIDNIEKYLFIQKVRYKNRLEYSIDVPEDLKQVRILYMVIQPIVENALIHGITPKRDGGKVQIIAEKRKKDLIISVIDNGNGFPPDVLKNIQNSKDNGGLGYQSANKRLKQYYGGHYGVEVVKSDYSGSTVNIVIPTDPRWR